MGTDIRSLLFPGTFIAVLTVLVLIIRWSVEEFHLNGNKWDNGAHWKNIVDFIIIGVTVLVVAVPEGLPLAVTLSLAYSVRVSLSLSLYLYVYNAKIYMKSTKTLQKRMGFY